LSWHLRFPFRPFITLFCSWSAFFLSNVSSSLYWVKLVIPFSLASTFFTLSCQRFFAIGPPFSLWNLQRLRHRAQKPAHPYDPVCVCCMGSFFFAFYFHQGTFHRKIPFPFSLPDFSSTVFFSPALSVNSGQVLDRTVVISHNFTPHVIIEPRPFVSFGSAPTVLRGEFSCPRCRFKDVSLPVLIRRSGYFSPGSVPPSDSFIIQTQRSSGFLVL